MPETLFCSPNTLSLEKKAAHLLYFLIKNHHFVDGKEPDPNDFQMDLPPTLKIA